MFILILTKLGQAKRFKNNLENQSQNCVNKKNGMILTKIKIFVVLGKKIMFKCLLYIETTR